MDKSTSQRIHFRERLYQRFGYDIDDVTYEAIIKKIRSNKAKFVYRQSNRLTVWIVDCNGAPIKVVYDSHSKTLVTALLPSMKEIR